MKGRRVKILEKCELCPHKCKVNRIKGEIGRCKAGKDIKIALADLHFYEEPCISGETGSGTIFFSGCNLNCKFCQNYKISQNIYGKQIEIEELAEEFLKLQNRKANNINLVTAFMYVPQIIKAIEIAKKRGLIIPIIYNSSGYESIETLKLLEGYIDVYLPDLKYYYNDLAKEVSNINNYFDVATEAIKEMYKQVGPPKFDENGMIKKGLMVRHLILPNYLENSKKVLEWLKFNLDNEVFINVMAQYFPSYKALETKDLNRKLTESEYKEIEKFVFELNIQNGYMQDLEENEEQYVPEFNCGID